MRLLVCYNPRTDKVNINYNDDRFWERELFTYNHYGHLILQYLYIEDKKVFYNKTSYQKYRKKQIKKHERKTKTIKWRIGNIICKIGKTIDNFGDYLMHGRRPKIVYVYRNTYPYWKDRY